MRGLREIVAEAEKAEIPHLLAEWGYVRPLIPGELELSIWFAYGPDGLFWLHRDASFQAETEATLHVCAAPSAQGRIASRWVLTAFEVIACLLGITALEVPGKEEWAGLLMRMGWQPTVHRYGRLWMRRPLPPPPPRLAALDSEALRAVG